MFGIQPKHAKVWFRKVRSEGKWLERKLFHFETLEIHVWPGTVHALIFDDENSKYNRKSIYKKVKDFFAALIFSLTRHIMTELRFQSKIKFLSHFIGWLLWMQRLSECTMEVSMFGERAARTSENSYYWRQHQNTTSVLTAPAPTDTANVENRNYKLNNKYLWNLWLT